MGSRRRSRNVTVSEGIDGRLLGSSQPRPYDRRVFVRAFFLSVVIVAAVIAAVILLTVSWGGGGGTDGPTMDLSSVFFRRGSVPDSENPCMVVQSHLEATRRGMYRTAYDFLSDDLKAQVDFESFQENAKSNRLLFSNLKRYSFPGYEETDGSSNVVGEVEYGFDGRSRVEARLTRNNGEWKISELDMVFQ